MSASFESARPTVLAATVVAHPAAAAQSPAAGGPLNREQILHATHACFHAFGYDGTTIRAIAARLGCAVGSIYRYFSDKRELLLACAEALFEPLLERTRQGDLDAEASLHRFITLAADHDELYRLLFWLSAAGDRSGTPMIVRKLLDAWSAHSPGASWEKRWATAHGLLMLGTPVADIISHFAADAGPAPRPSVAPPADPVQASPPPAEDEEDEVDVTLL